MLNVVIWGAREQYDLFINQIKYEELKGNICVKGIIDPGIAYKKNLDGYEILAKDELKDMGIDCVILTSVSFHFGPAKTEILSLNPNVRVINARVLNIPFFDFARYYSILTKKVSIISNTCWGGWCTILFIWNSFHHSLI